MKFIKKVGMMVFFFVLTFSLTSCSCGLNKYNSEDIKKLYKTIYENQIDVDDGTNSIFVTDYTVDIEYIPVIENITLYNGMVSNEYNLYALDNFYNELFRSIFKYYENWHISFYEHADDVVSIEEFNHLYSELTELNTSLIKLNEERDKLETIIAREGVINAPSISITNYIYNLNQAIEQSLDFVNCFRDIHISKIFTDTNLSTNTVAQALDDVLLSFANFMYFDNIKPFEVIKGSEALCDISVLVKAYADGNMYVKLNTLKALDTSLTDSVMYALDNGNDEEILINANEFMYYSNVLKQKILTAKNISDNINYYRLSLYRYGSIAGGVDAYTKTLSNLELASYEFIESLEDFIYDEYLDILASLT